MAEKMLNTNEEKRKKEPFVVLSKRDTLPLAKSLGIRAAAIVLALVICGILTILVTGDNPLSVFATFFDGALGTAQRVWVTFQNMAILLCISLAVTPAFRMRFWNTGAEGQTLIGCLVTAWMMYSLGGKIPDWLLIILLVVGSIAAGAIWGVIPGFFKSIWNTNETLFTLMMNYVAIQLVEFFLKIADKSGSNTVGPNLLSHGWLPYLFGQQYLLNIVLVALLTVVMYVYLNYSKHGYEIAVVGESEKTARYIGINVKTVIIRTMILSGAICGLAGLLLVAGTSHSIDSSLVGGRGFTAIMVSWLAKFNPVSMIFSSFLLVFLERGAGQVTTTFGLNSSFSDILTGIILFFIIGCEFFINYKLHFRFSKTSEKEVTSK